jgi:hypothetical protein
VAGRAKKNTIKFLKRSDGQLTKDRKEMENPELLSGLFRNVISEEMNRDLCKDFTGEEISDALFQIGPLKALSPDGFSTRFFQLNWGTLKEDVIRVV